MNQNFWNRFASTRKLGRDFYVSLCITMQLYAGMMLSDKYTVRVVGVQGPSMLPAIDERDNLVMLDCFTTRFLR